MRELKNAIRLDIQRILDSLFLVVVGVLIWVFFGILKGLMGLVFVIAMIAVMTTTSAFYGKLGLDGLEDADLLYDTLPLRRRTVMISHYLVSLAYLLAAEIVLVPVLLLGEILGMRAGGDWWAAASAAVGIMLVVFAVMVPVLIRFTDARGVAVLVVVAVIAGVGIYLLGQLMSPLPGWVLAGWPWLLLVAGLVAWVVSLLVAIRVYQRQDH
ncbi:ABC-2 transporter permease [Arachnia propionica]|uniref:ABC-2 transporter permease n=1 Tax=Arachnia propionica TaxID=1750 RepID=UPI002432B753|nr:ABC-2 transporter permease [Arachnia propionica]